MVSGAINQNEIQAVQSINGLVTLFGVDANLIPQFLLGNTQINYVEGKIDPINKKYELGFNVEGIPLSENDALGLIFTISIHYNTTLSKYQIIQLGGKITWEGSDNRTRSLVVFFNQKKSEFLLVAYNREQEVENVTLSELVGGLAPELSGLLPDDLLGLNVSQNIFGVYSPSVASGGSSLKPVRKLLIGIGITVPIEFANLPLLELYLGTELPDGATVNVELLLANDTFSHTDLKAISTVFEDVELPVTLVKKPIIKKSQSTVQQELVKGFSLAGHIGIGEYIKTVLMPIPKLSGARSLRSRPTLYNTTTENGEKDPLLTVSDNAVWLSIQQGFGKAVYFEKIGLQYKRGEIHIVPVIALKVADFTLTLTGVSISSPVSDFDPNYNLDGFNLRYESNNLKIEGAFLRVEKNDYTEYLGMATLNFGVKNTGGKPPKKLGLSAIGAYTYYQDEPSLFLYAVLDYPLGGPPFFFVTGLALGFGYNRSLKAPTISTLSQFPLVSQAIGSSPSSWNSENIGQTVNNQLEILASYITPSIGSGFGAIGVKFTSFKLIDCFGLLKFQLGDKFEVNLLATASMKIPPISSGFCVAQVNMTFLARFAPDDGILSVEAQLDPSSYILSPNCRLTGGFAFYSWFAGDRDGDFVITLGGYHPRFEKPSHYPTVPRLGFEWRIGNSITISGQAYFALCAHAVMAGGRLEAKYESGKTEAAFTVAADFLISWKPYHYDISYEVSFRAEHGCLGPVSVGAKLHIWGPDFGGYAKIKIVVVSVKINFGDQSSRYADPLTWSDFRGSFLPKNEDVCTINCTRGLTKQLKKADNSSNLFVINPKEFELVVDSAIPITNASHPAGNAGGKVFSLRTMKKQENLNSSYHISIKREGEQEDVGPQEFSFVAVTKQVPSALWGEPKLTDKGKLLPAETNEDRFVEDALCGFRVVPGKPPTPGDTDEIDIEKLMYDVESVSNVYNWQTIPAFVENPMEEPDRRNNISSTITTNSSRDALLEALGFILREVHITKSQELADAFAAAPKIAQS